METQLQQSGLIQPTSTLNDLPLLELTIKSMWVNNGDQLRQAFTGSGNLKSSYTKKGKQPIHGILDDGKKIATRLYKNNFTDNDRQIAIENFLGIDAPMEKRSIQEIWIEEELNIRENEFTQTKN